MIQENPVNGIMRDMDTTNDFNLLFKEDGSEKIGDETVEYQHNGFI
jgi:hypothetical protein